MREADDTIHMLMDDFQSAVTEIGNLTRIEDAITAWRDRTTNDGVHDEALIDLLADVMIDAVRQIEDRREKRSAVRITEPDGSRITFSWTDGEGPRSREFEQQIIRSVKAALATKRTAS